MDESDFLQRLQSSQFWREFAPELSISTREPIQSELEYRPEPNEVAKQVEYLRARGYCLMPRIVPQDHLQPMRSCVERLHAARLLPLFVYVYDEPWRILLELSLVFSMIFDGRFVIPPSFYAWFVDADNPTAFPPHRDLPKLENLVKDDGRPNYLTLWIPLTDVSLEGSCIHLVPTDLDPCYPQHLTDNTVSDTANVRALPAKAGTLIFWNLGVLHWGSPPQPNAKPRISLAFYIQRADQPLLNYPEIDLARPLSLDLRLALIGKQISSYYRGNDPFILSLGRELESLSIETRRARVMKRLWQESGDSPKKTENFK